MVLIVGSNFSTLRKTVSTELDLNQKSNSKKFSVLQECGGECGKFFRSIDWSQHPMGPVELWPCSLITTLNIIFRSRQPMCVFWGKDFFQFYNDDYVPSLPSGKHPQGIGQKGEESWSEAWKMIKPQLDIAIIEGQCSFVEDQLIPLQNKNRAAKPNNEIYWTYSYSPIIGDDGTIDGSLVVCTETKRNKAERAKLEAIFYGTESAMVIFRGPELIYEMVNQKYKDMIPDRNFIGKKLTEVFPNQKYSDFEVVLKRVYDTGIPHQFSDFVSTSKNRNTGEIETRYFDMSFSRISDGSENEFMVVGHVADVTEKFLARKKLEASEAKTLMAYKEAEQTRNELYSFFMQAPSPMVILSGPEHRFVLANPLYEKYIGRAVIGRTIREAFKDDDQEDFIRILDKTYQTGEPFVGKNLAAQILDDTGTLRNLRIDVSYTAFRDGQGEVKGILVFVRDVTDEFNAHINMEEYNIELRSAIAEAEKANQLKSAFLANMSHEIRTPLGAILGFTDIIRNSQISASEQNHYLDIITRNGHALTKIIDDILDLSKIEAGKLEMEKTPLCLTELIKDIIAMFVDRAASKGLALGFDGGELPKFLIDSDPIRIRQVLINLIGNAIKFTGRGSINVSGHYEKLNDEKLKICIFVADTGVGMTVAQSERLFRPFTQGDSTSTRNHGGTGLGLALSQKLGRALGGDVTLSSCETGVGCTFKFVLEASISKSLDPYIPVSPVEISRKETKTLEGYRVLVVDDSADNRALIGLILKREGAKVGQAADGEEAVKMALNESYDAVLMDIQMPGIDGYEALAKLRNENYQTPVFALTAHAMKEDRTRAISSGFSDHISKPINPKNLVNSILTHARPQLH